MISSAIRTPNLNDWLYIAAGILLVLTGMKIFYAFHRTGPLKFGQISRYLKWFSGLFFVIIGVLLAWPATARILFPGH